MLISKLRYVKAVLTNGKIPIMRYWWLARLKEISMLHIETLFMANEWAKNSYNVLEIGTYIGGSTIALSKGTQGQVIAIEPGGSHNHNLSPSSDILRDLRINLKKWNCNNVFIIEGFSEDLKVYEELRTHLAESKIDFLMLDANGNVESLLVNYKPLLSQTCRVIIDDYSISNNLSGGKNNQVVKEVDELLKRRALKNDFVNGYGTLFGSINLENL